jgi:hypothetical protein
MRSPFCVPIYCALCGGPGDAHIRDARFILSSEFFHKDPRICKDYLAAKARQAERAKQSEAA